MLLTISVLCFIPLSQDVAGVGQAGTLLSENSQWFYTEDTATVTFCLPGKYQARILSESLLSPAEYQREVHYELVTGKVDSLGAFFSSLCPGKPVRGRCKCAHWEDAHLWGGGIAGVPSCLGWAAA